MLKATKCVNTKRYEIKMTKTFKIYKVGINKFLETDFTIKINVKKQRRFDRSTVIFKLKSKNFLACA
jgi:hypothetical protein